MKYLIEARKPLTIAGTRTRTAGGIFNRARANILGVSVDAVNMERALAAIEEHLLSGRSGYVCAVGVHGILESLHCAALAQAYSESILNIPDGTPTVWIGRLRGFRWMDHVTGPALMLQIFSRITLASCSHFFYGGKPGIADELASIMQRRFPRTRIAGTYTPPFRELSALEEEKFVAEVNVLRPDILWVGISTPRQELWMRRMLPRLKTRLMFGVGAAFDYHTGHIRECPDWVKRAGFNWLHRLAQDPKRLWRRNLNNTAFLWHIALQLAGLADYSARGEVNTADWNDDRKADRTYSDVEKPVGAHSSHQ